jgi:hypothetical protein
MEGAARHTGFSVISLRQKQWRRDVGLRATRIGKRLGFRISDLDAWLESRREIHEPKTRLRPASNEVVEA